MLLFGLLCAGCATSSLDRSRRDFYRGDVAAAEALLDAEENVSETDRVLFLMERGTIRQAMGDYQGSADDYIAAADLIRKSESHSVSQGAASMVINDNVQDFFGAPYERTCMHALAAMSHLGRGHWTEAAIEARRLLETVNPEARGEHPDVAFGRYIAGLCFELNEDPSNAALQYKLAGAASATAEVDPQTGWVTSTSADQRLRAGAATNFSNELICLIAAGHAPPDGQPVPSTPPSPPYADAYAGDAYLGRSVILTDTYVLARKADELIAAKRAVKTGARIAIKDATAQAAGGLADNEFVEDLVRAILIGVFERPDFRRWETLPRYFAVIRVPCPVDMSTSRLVYHDETGKYIDSFEVRRPLHRREDKVISFHRPLPRLPAPPPSGEDANAPPEPLTGAPAE